MNKYVYTVVNKDGRRTSGEVEASNRKAAMKILSENEMIVTNLAPARNGRTGLSRQLGVGGFHVRGEELMAFTQALASMLDAGIPLKTSMDILSRDIESKDLRQVLVEIGLGLNSGAALSDLLRRYPEVFSKLYVAMVTAGETGGKLPGLLFRLADYIENAENLKNKIKAALYYPGMVLGFAVLVGTFIFIFGIPKFAAIYKGMGAQLPLPTQIFINVAQALSSVWYLLFAVLLIGGWLLIRYLRSERGQLAIDGLKLRTAVFGPLFKRLAIARFARTLGILYASGVPIIQAMELVAGGMGNRVLEAVVMGALQNVREGESLAEPLRRSKAFTNMAVSLIAAGEETGKLDTMLGKLADFYESQVDIALKALTGLLEPLIMIGVGCIIGMVILVLALPFLNLSSIVIR